MFSPMTLLIHLSNCKYEIVHYKAWAESTQHKFEDTWHEQQPLELVLGKGIHLTVFSFSFLFIFVKIHIEMCFTRVVYITNQDTKLLYWCLVYWAYYEILMVYS